MNLEQTVSNVEELKAATATCGLTALGGSNLSGRTDLLRQLTGLPTPAYGEFVQDHKGAIYLGQDVPSFLSSIAGTVTDELRLHGAESSKDIVLPLLSLVGMDVHGQRNPFTLSGGEQVILAILCCLALRPHWYAIDSALEQLAVDVKVQIIEALLGSLGGGKCVIADNRLEEWRTRVSEMANARTAPSSVCADTLPLSAGSLANLAPITAPVIYLDRLSFHYPYGPDVLSEVKLELLPGKVHVLIGRNGAGKSTLARLLVGIHRPTSGRVLVNGREERLWKHPASLVAYHYQNPDLQLFMTSVRDEIAIGARREDLSGSRSETIATQLFALEKYIDHHPLDLPFVLRKRVAMAATVAMWRPWLILDEPTLSQDDAALRSIAEIVSRLAELGMGVIVITHSPTFRALLSATEYTLENGVIHTT